MNQELLNKLKSQVRIGGKGTPRRKFKRSTPINQTNGSTSVDVKLADQLKKLNMQSVGDCFEIDMFKSNNKVQVFERPVVQANEQLGIHVISGRSSEKELSELVPSILNQLGPESLASLKKLAETYKKNNPNDENNDDDIPNLIENFDENDENKQEENEGEENQEENEGEEDQEDQEEDTKANDKDE